MDRDQGLSSKEVEKSAQRYGRNTLDTLKTPSWLDILWRQFQSPLIYLLVAASGVAFLLGDVVDSLVIWGAILANISVGFVQENRAQKALTSLRKLITVQARVIRDGKERVIDSQELVPGDLVLIGAGAKVPADLELIEATNLEVNEAVLTGESIPVSKVQGAKIKKGEDQDSDLDKLFMGTVVVRGQGRGVVAATGRQTKMGEVAQLVIETEEEKTPLQRQLNGLSKTLVIGVLLISAAIFLIGILMGSDPVVMFATGVALAVAAIPEGLALAVTVTLVLGMQKIFTRQALVRNLLAVDTLGATTVICTDKTGTLTTGRMRMVEVAVPRAGQGGQQEEKDRLERVKLTKKSLRESDVQVLLTVGALCNEATFDHGGEAASWEFIGSPTETALLAAAAAAGLPREKLVTDNPRVAEIPFESQAQFMATKHEVWAQTSAELTLGLTKGSGLILVKGSPERISSMLNKPIDQGVVEKMTADGLRVLALAYRTSSSGNQDFNSQELSGLTLAGLVGLIDPLRPEAREAIRSCQGAGLTPVMLTGDHRLTAKAIAKELGLPVGEKNIITGAELESLTDAELYERIDDLRVYARVSPRDKIRIIDAWQARGEVVAMTGDGVNDAPALKSADIGVALGSGTDVAKETADMVLLDDNFKTIVSAIEGGRVVFDNIRKVALYLLSDSFSEVVLIIISLIARWPLPLLPAQILYINILTDGFPDIALTYEPEETEVMDEPPRGLFEPVLNVEMKTLIGLISFFTGLGSLAIFYYFWKSTGDLVLARTVTFATLGLDSLLYVFSVRSLRHSIWDKSPLSNRPLLAAVALGFLLQLVAIYFGPVQGLLQTVPLNRSAWMAAFLQAAVVLVLIEVTKHIFIVRSKR